MILASLKRTPVHVVHGVVEIWPRDQVLHDVELIIVRLCACNSIFSYR